MKKKGAFLIVLTIALLSVLLVFALLLSRQTPSEVPSGSENLEGVTVLAIGESTLIFKDVVHKLKSCNAQVEQSNGLPDTTQGLKEGMIALFDGEWLGGRVNDRELHAFLRDAVSKRIKLVTIGGATSKFFEALNAAGIEELIEEGSVVRNPAYWNPPLVGYRLETVNGQTGPVILISNSKDVNVLVEALFNW